MLRNVLIAKGLNNRQCEVTELVTKGLNNKEIANQLFITEKTVKFHLTQIYKKLNAKSRAQLIVFCLPHIGFLNEKPKKEVEPSISPFEKLEKEIKAAEKELLKLKRKRPPFFDDVLKALTNYQDDIFGNKRLVDYVKEQVNELDFPQSYQTVRKMFEYVGATYTEEDIKAVGYPTEVVKEEALRYID